MRTTVVVIGGGQAGLAMSWWLTRAGVDHVVLEREIGGGDHAPSGHDYEGPDHGPKCYRADPDLAALAALSDQVQQQNIAQRKQARAAWLALYGTFSAEQKATVRDAINARMARMDAFRQRMQNRLSGG